MRSCILLPIIVLGAISCHDPQNKPINAGTAISTSLIEARMQAYVSAMRVMDVEAIAAFFSPTGELFEPGIPPIRTRDSILVFLRSFPGVVVDSASVKAERIEVFEGTALLWGSFHEKLSFPGQPTSEQDGKFVTEWKLQPDSAWLIERMYRIPLPPPMPQP
jgi:ketosteroid isomerase-like protein